MSHTLASGHYYLMELDSPAMIYDQPEGEGHKWGNCF